ncbi:DNA cytosine methyltransferase, partial [Morganella morganii]|nr:DNA cytosine methyltransferase [Morganella morganii]
AIDFFCGAGGVTCGLKQAGFSVVAGIEIEDIAAKTYQLNHPEHILLKQDIKKIDPVELMHSLNLKEGSLDLIAGCPPCQGFSSHRTRNKSISTNDERNDLIFELLKFIKVFLPKVVMIENVPALSKDDRINVILKQLGYLGYFINDKTLQVKDAASYGVPQRRKRMILIASRFGFLDEPNVINKPLTVRDAIYNLSEPGTGNDDLHDYIQNRTDKVLKIIENIPKDGGSRVDLPRDLWLPCHIKKPDGYKDVYGRMSWDKVSPTITGGCTNPSKGRFIHPEKNRAITLREAALLQTFPIDYKFSLDKGRDSVALMIGNALPPRFIYVHALKIKEHLIKLSKEKYYECQI